MSILASERTVIINCGFGNLHSVERALKICAAQREHHQVLVSENPHDLETATRIVLPGQGAFGECMSGLNTIPGMREILERRVISDRIPYLGICVGMQIMIERGHEYGSHEGLGWIKGEVKAMAPSRPDIKMPHMGWNEITVNDAHPLAVLATPRTADYHFYFVHSYAVENADDNTILASTDYDGVRTAIIGKDNMIGVQFHPEKSQNNGLELLGRFLDWQPDY